MTRPSTRDYFLDIAAVTATRATCLRKQVGAVLVRDNRIIATGYNGSPPGEPHCSDPETGCLIENSHCVRTVHAEINALLYAAKDGVSVDGATLYCTITPCAVCMKLLRTAGVKSYIWREDYP